MKRVASIVAKEVREAIPATIFFLVLFHMMALTKAVSLDEYDLTALRASFVTVSALIVAKAILVVEALPLSRRFSRTLALHVLWKTLLFGTVAVFFKLLEEFVPLLIRDRSLAIATDALLRETAWPLFGVNVLWLLLGLLLYTLLIELVRSLGADSVGKLLFRSAPAGEATPRNAA